MSLLGSAGDTALRNLTQPKEGAPVIAGLTWGELDRLVDEDPIGALERAWEEIQQLRAEVSQLRASLVDGVDESARRGGQIAELQNQLYAVRVERDALSRLLRGMTRRLAKHRQAFHSIRRAGIWEISKLRSENKQLRGMERRARDIRDRWADYPDQTLTRAARHILGEEAVS